MRIARVTDVLYGWAENGDVTVCWIDAKGNTGTTHGPVRNTHIKALTARFWRDNPVAAAAYNRERREPNA